MTSNQLTCIIDDDQIFTMLAKKLFEIKQFCKHTLCFKNGEEALAFFVTNAQNPQNLPEIVFLDINMPELDGWGFLEKMKNVTLSKQVKVFILTSSINPADIEKSKSFEMVSGYLQKPLKLEQLQQVELN